MTFEELLKKYQALLLENGNLKEDIENLNTKLGVSEHRAIPYGRFDNTSVDSLFPTLNTFPEASNYGSEGKAMQSNINGMSDPEEKIMLFRSLFKGRDDFLCLLGGTYFEPAFIVVPRRFHDPSQNSLGAIRKAVQTV